MGFPQNGSVTMTTQEIPSVAKGWLSTLCCWEAAVYTLYWTWKKMDVKLMMMMMMVYFCYKICSITATSFSWCYETIKSNHCCCHLPSGVGCFHCDTITITPFSWNSRLICWIQSGHYVEIRHSSSSDHKRWLKSSECSRKKICWTKRSSERLLKI